MEPLDLKNELLNQSRFYLSSIIESLDYDNLDTCKQKMNQLLDYLKESKDQPVFNVRTQTVKKEAPIPSTPDDAPTRLESSKLDKPEESEDEEQKQDWIKQDDSTIPATGYSPTLYRFERKIRGGFLSGADVFVPELITRHLNLCDGDWLSIWPKSSSETSDRPEYFFKVEKRGPGLPLQKRVEYNLCPVEKDSIGLVATKCLDTGEDIRIDEIPYTIRIKDDDCIKYQLEEGCLVDLAFYEGSHPEPKVTWKWPIEDVTDSFTTPTKKRKRNKSSVDDDIEQTLKGKSVLVMCDEADRTKYQESIEAHGGTFLWANAHVTTVSSLESIVGKADQVILVLDGTKHIRMTMLKHFCKKHNVLFIPIWGKGISQILRIAENSEDAV